MYPFHPLTVHLPIGLLLGHALLTVLALWRRDTTFEVGAWHCLWLGWIGSLVALASGVLDAARLLAGSSEPSQDALGWINAHALIGLGIAVLYWQLWKLRRRNPQILTDPQARRGYLVRLLIGVILLGVDGWLGGHLVYGLQLAVRP